jgi:hypothetical protein
MARSWPLEGIDEAKLQDCGHSCNQYSGSAGSSHSGTHQDPAHARRPSRTVGPSLYAGRSAHAFLFVIICFPTILGKSFIFAPVGRCSLLRSYSAPTLRREPILSCMLPCGARGMDAMRLRGGSERADNAAEEGSPNNDEMVDDWDDEHVQWINIRVQNLCFGRNDIFELLVDPDTLVKDFKTQLYLNHSTTMCDPEQMEVTCKGREMQDVTSSQLSDYGIGTYILEPEGLGATVIVKQKFINIALNEANARGEEALGPDSIQGLIQSPMFQHLLSNPQLLQQVMQTPQFQQLLQASPELRSILEDPSALKKAMQGETYGEDYAEEGFTIQYPNKQDGEGQEDSHARMKRIAAMEPESYTLALKGMSEEERSTVERVRARMLREKRGWDKDNFKARLAANATLASEYAALFRRFKTIEAVRGNLSASESLTAAYPGVASVLNCAHISAPKGGKGSGAISSDFLQDALRLAMEENDADEGPPRMPMTLPSASLSRGSPPLPRREPSLVEGPVGPLTVHHTRLQELEDQLQQQETRIDDMEVEIQKREDLIASNVMSNNPRYSDAVSGVTLALIEYYMAKLHPQAGEAAAKDLPPGILEDLESRMKPIIAVETSKNQTLTQHFMRMMDTPMQENMAAFIHAVEAFLSCLIQHPRVSQVLTEALGHIDLTAKSLTPPVDTTPITAPARAAPTSTETHAAAPAPRPKSPPPQDERAPSEPRISQKAPPASQRPRGPANRLEDNIGRLGLSDLGAKAPNARALGTERVKLGDAAMRNGDFAAAAADFEAAADLLASVEDTENAVAKLRKLAQAAAAKHKESQERLAQQQKQQQEEQKPAADNADSDEEMQDEETLRRRRLRVLLNTPPPPPPANMTVGKTDTYWPNPPNSGLTDEEWRRLAGCKLYIDSQIQSIKLARQIQQLWREKNDTLEIAQEVVDEYAALNESRYEEMLQTMDFPYSEWERDTETMRSDDDDDDEAPAATLPPEQRYKKQLEQMVDMGFADVEANLKALIDTGGSVEAAISQLIGGG